MTRMTEYHCTTILLEWEAPSGALCRVVTGPFCGHAGLVDFREKIRDLVRYMDQYTHIPDVAAIVEGKGIYRWSVPSVDIEHLNIAIEAATNEANRVAAEWSPPLE